MPLTFTEQAALKQVEYLIERMAKRHPDDDAADAADLAEINRLVKAIGTPARHRSESDLHLLNKTKKAVRQRWLDDQYPRRELKNE